MKDKYIFTSQVQTLFIIHAANWLEEIVRQPQGEGGWGGWEADGKAAVPLCASLGATATPQLGKEHKRRNKGGFKAGCVMRLHLE